MADFKEAEGIWFYFDPHNESEGGVCLRELSVEENDRIEQLTVKKKKKFRRGVAYDDIKTDEKLARKLQLQYCIVDWKNVQLNGQPLECSNENKERIMKVLDFAKFVADCLIELSETNKSLEEAQLKNSGNSSNGNQESQIAKTV